MSKRKAENEEIVRSWITRWDGQSERFDYHPFLTVPDIPSQGRSTMVWGLKTERIHHYFSDEIDHTKTRVKSPQTNGICERAHQTILNEFYRVTFRKKVYSDLESLQTDLDEYMNRFNTERTHQGKRCKGRTPMATFFDGLEVCKEKNLTEKLAA